MSDTPVTFDQLALSAPLRQALDEAGYEAPSPIQAAAIPPLLEGRDIIGQAQTGTGKTAAFALPLLQKVELTQRAPQVLVLAPTRELAIQVAEAFQSYARHLSGFHVLPIYGGQGMGQQLTQLKRGVHVVVGTPGRVADHLRRGTLETHALRAVVLDEADEMLRMGFIDEVDWIIAQTPADRQVALFSATMPGPVRRIAEQYLREPVEVKIAAKTSTSLSIHQRYWLVSGLHKLDALTRLLEVEPCDAAIVFVRTKSATDEVAEKLEARGYAAAALNGDLPQALREKVVERVKSGDLDIIVATDVAARGLDVSRISHVINYDIPYDTEAYVHRIGRTGRAGRNGEAILFVAPREKRMLRSIEQATRQPIEPMSMPTRDEVNTRRVERFRERIAHTLASADLDFFRGLVDSFQHDEEAELLDIAAALAMLAQQEQPLLLSEADMPDVVERPMRDERDERGGDRPERGPRNEEPMTTYRLSVGARDGVEPKHIVGAIANEIGIKSAQIGRIRVNFDHTTVELPDSLPPQLLRHLREVKVFNRPLLIEVHDGEVSYGRRDDRGGPKPFHKKKFGDKKFSKEGGKGGKKFDKPEGGFKKKKKQEK